MKNHWHLYYIGNTSNLNLMLFLYKTIIYKIGIANIKAIISVGLRCHHTWSQLFYVVRW